MKLFRFFILSLIIGDLQACNPWKASCKPGKPRFTWTGCVQPTIMYDSRVGFTSREGSIYLLPLIRVPDCSGQDINKRGQWNTFAIETSFQLIAQGPDVAGAKTFGYIDGDFDGTFTLLTDTLRLREGYLKLIWPQADFLYGQTWHPLYQRDCSPRVLADGSGQPFDAFKRVAQLRIISKNEEFDWFAAASAELFPTTGGPQGPSTLYARNSLMPEFSLSARKYIGDAFIGAVVNVKRIVPRVINDELCKVDESVINIGSCLYANWSIPQWNISILNKLLFTQNGTRLAMIGGYGVQQEFNFCEGTERRYTNLNVITVWTDIQRARGAIKPGIFIAYSKNLGSSQPMQLDKETGQPIVYGFLAPIDNAVRVSPRLVYEEKPIRFVMEMEMTQATYGDAFTSCGRVSNPYTVRNFRLEFASFYCF